LIIDNIIIFLNFNKELIPRVFVLNEQIRVPGGNPVAESREAFAKEASRLLHLKQWIEKA
jgi:hypothetical protein